MSRYVVVGAGGIGVTVAAQLRRVGRDVVLVARGAQLAALRAGEFRYSRPDGTRPLSLPSVGGPDEIELAGDDVLVLATKAQDVEPVIEQWARRPVRQPDGTVVPAGASIPVLTLQNGLEAERVANEAIAERAYRAWQEGATAGELGADDLLTVLPQLRPGDEYADLDAELAAAPAAWSAYPQRPVSTGSEPG